MLNVNRKQLVMRLLALTAGIVSVMLVPTTMWAQAGGENASIIGVVTDQTGNVIQNATVTITSPALQVPQLIAKTDVGGNYKFVVLPAPGVYRLTFAATGFGTIVKQGVTLTVGFTAKIDTVLPVGTTSSEVVVTTAGPVVDTVSTAVTSTLQADTLNLVPKPLGMQDPPFDGCGCKPGRGISGRGRQQSGCRAEGRNRRNRCERKCRRYSSA